MHAFLCREQHSTRKVVTICNNWRNSLCVVVMKHRTTNYLSVLRPNDSLAPSHLSATAKVERSVLVLVGSSRILFLIYNYLTMSDRCDKPGECFDGLSER